MKIKVEVSIINGSGENQAAYGHVTWGGVKEKLNSIWDLWLFKVNDDLSEMENYVAEMNDSSWEINDKELKVSESNSYCNSTDSEGLVVWDVKTGWLKKYYPSILLMIQHMN